MPLSDSLNVRTFGGNSSSDWLESELEDSQPDSDKKPLKIIWYI